MRGVRGLSQEALAHESGINRTYLSSVERSERNGRERLVLVFEVRNRDTGALLTRLRDTSLLNFTPRNDQ